MLKQCLSSLKHCLSLLSRSDPQVAPAVFLCQPASGCEPPPVDELPWRKLPEVEVVTLAAQFPSAAGGQTKPGVLWLSICTAVKVKRRGEKTTYRLVNAEARAAGYWKDRKPRAVFASSPKRNGRGVGGRGEEEEKAATSEPWHVCVDVSADSGLRHATGQLAATLSSPSCPVRLPCR